MSGKSALKVEVIEATEADRELRAHLNAWFGEQFGHIPYVWADPEQYVLAALDDQPAGMLVIVSRNVSVGKQRITVGGIGGVVMRPELRGLGIATAMLNKAGEFIKHTLGADFGLLICRREVAPVYAKLGWVRVSGPTTFQQPAGRVTYPHDTMVFKCSDREWPDGPIDLCGLPW